MGQFLERPHFQTLLNWEQKLCKITACSQQYRLKYPYYLDWCSPAMPELPHSLSSISEWFNVLRLWYRKKNLCQETTAEAHKPGLWEAARKPLFSKPSWESGKNWSPPSKAPQQPLRNEPRSPRAPEDPAQSLSSAPTSTGRWGAVRNSPEAPAPFPFYGTTFFFFNLLTPP